MSKKCDSHDRIRLYPEAKKALKRFLSKSQVPTTMPRLANQAIIKGVEVLEK